MGPTAVAFLSKRVRGGRGEEEIGGERIEKEGGGEGSEQAKGKRKEAEGKKAGAWRWRGDKCDRPVKHISFDDELLVV
eukprot:768582-Hanusia_phi.AAC.3